jgi:hypothetical protein
MHCSVTGNSVLKLNVTVSTQHWAVGKGFWHTTFRANTFDMETNGTYTPPENMFVTVVRRFLSKNVYSKLKKYGLCLWYLFCLVLSNSSLCCLWHSANGRPAILAIPAISMVNPSAEQLGMEID